MENRGALNTHSVDLDGVLFKRIPIQGHALLRLARIGAGKLFAAPQLPRKLDRSIQPDGKWGMRASVRYVSLILHGGLHLVRSNLFSESMKTQMCLSTQAGQLKSIWLILQSQS